MSQSTESIRFTHRSITLVAFLTFLNCLNFIDRQLLASFANFIVPDLELTNAQFGLLSGLFFVFFYAIAGLMMGLAADVMHRPRLIMGALILWSGLTAASGAARGFISLAIPRMLIGIGESALTPTAMSLLGERIPAAKRGLAAGIYYMGVPIGAGLSLLMAGSLGPLIGWRNCFYALGAVGLLAAPFLLLIRDDSRLSGAERRQMLNSSVLKLLFQDFWREVSKSRPLQFTIAGGVCIHLIIGAATFEQLWLVRERGFDAAEIAIISGWVAVSAGIAGNLFGGIAGDAWSGRTGRSRASFLFWVLLLFLPLNLAYRFVEPGSVIFWCGFFFAYFQLGAFYGPAFATLQELSSPRVRASVIAFSLLILNAIGVGGGVTLGGYIIDHLAAEGVAQPYTWALFGFTAMAGFAVPLFYLASRFHDRENNQLTGMPPASGSD